jgi:hypothetical protein
MEKNRNGDSLKKWLDILRLEMSINVVTTLLKLNDNLVA